MGVIVEIAFQSLAYASVLYLISVGLSVTLGLMGFVNLAHGIFAMAGGYLAAVAVSSYGVPWPVMLVASPLAVALLAALLERALYARLYGRSELDQVLFSIGLIFIAGALVRLLLRPDAAADAPARRPAATGSARRRSASTPTSSWSSASARSPRRESCSGWSGRAWAR